LADLDGPHVGRGHQEKVRVVGEFNRFRSALGGLDADRSVLRGGQRAADMRLREGWRGKQHTNKNRCGCNRYPRSSRHEHLISLPWRSADKACPPERLEWRQVWRPNLDTLKTSRLDRRNFGGRLCPRMGHERQDSRDHNDSPLTLIADMPADM